uniref:Phospholipid-transporting ATPase n=1 Tax=Globodera rostochiensis TaxID=31243 RepID=A0A914I0U0_GLORO
MDWLRAHLPSYSAIRDSTFASLTSSMSSQQSSVGGGGHAQQKRGSANGAVAPRTIVVNGAQQPQKYCNNQISTCKYNVMTFLPRFLIEQFRRYSNVFFLIIAVLQQIPEVSPTGRYTTADIKRRRMDIEVNNYKVEVLDTAPALVAGGAKIRVAKWKQLRVGEIIRVKEGQFFPADIVLLSSSEAMGMAYIETAQLDGETNLKIRQAIPNTAQLTDMAQLRALNAQIECEPPNRRVNEFAGTLRVANDEKAPLSIGQFLLRGAKLKNCRWVFGVVVYTGHDSRLLMNSTSAPLKTSRIDVMTNQRIVILFLMLVLITVVSVIGAEVFNKWLLDGHWYTGAIGHWSFWWNMLTFFILYNNLIPISLQVTLEIVRFFQASYINQDILMYDEASDVSATARTSNLNEELGQVQFLMTDKTGTLTRNIMTFKRCQIGPIGYGDDDREDFDDPQLRHDMTSGRNGNGAQIYEFLTMLATCHSVVPEREESGHIRFQASSPDEAALVRAAQNQGFTFHTRRPNEIVVETGGSDRTFELLNALVFTSDRKRMSVILREKSADGAAEIKLFCKGADNVIFERLSKELNDRQMLARCNGALNDYAQKGYRTLCFASAVLDPAVYAQWSRDFKTASTAIEEREKQLEAVAEQIECNLRLIAVTAIEDKLQENVPLTIRTLLAAGIRIWMLTGDKLETAVQIAQSSSLCHKDTELMVLAERSFDVVLAKLHEYTLKSHQFMLSNTAFALVIDGASLHHAVIGEARRVFAELIVNCHSVICCRMTPMQKAEVVEIVKSLGNNKTVMAVGDGANDVAMIQAANVGVGISGVEGLQAASVSDYSIAQFQFLRRLLLVHGTWNFERSVKVILYSFYKNICLYIIELWFAFFSAFSGVTIFERWTIAMFNVTFTALPPIILGLFDRPLSQRMILRHPQLYQSFQQMAFSNDRFFMWVGVSLWHSLLLFFLNFGFYSSGVVWAGGNTGGWLMFGNSLYTFVVATVCLKALLECDSWTWIIVGCCLGSILLWFVYLIIYSRIWPLFPLGSDMSGMFMIMVSSPSFWMALIFIPVTTLLFDFVVKSFCTSLRPSPRERFCLREKRRTLVGCNITDLDGGVRREETAHFDNHYHNQQQQQTLRQRSHEKQPNRPPQKSQHPNCSGNAALLQCPSNNSSSSAEDDVQQQQQKGGSSNNLFSHPHSTDQQPHFHLSNTNNNGQRNKTFHCHHLQPLR